MNSFTVKSYWKSYKELSENIQNQAEYLKNEIDSMPPSMLVAVERIHKGTKGRSTKTTKDCFAIIKPGRICYRGQSSCRFGGAA